MSKNIKPLNNKGQAHGYWEWYWAGDLIFKRFFHNGERVGYEEYYHSVGELTRKRYNI